jgi:hypothetical protein
MAATCSLAFKYRYVDKLETGPKGAAAAIGVAAHKAQELHLAGIKIGQALDEAIDESKDVLTENEIEKVKSFAYAIESFTKKIDDFKVKHKVAEVLVEKKFAITPDFQPCDFFDERGMLRGVVDFCLLLESGHAVIIDHKTGKPRPIDYYGAQLDTYAVMAKVHYPELKGVQYALHFMASSEIVWAPPKSATHVVDVLYPWLLNYVIQRENFVKTYVAKPGFYCKWCDYRNVCPEVAGEEEQRRGDREGKQG